MLIGEKAIKQMGVLGLLGVLGVMISGCGTPTPASYYSSKRSVLGTSSYPAPTSGQTNSPVSTAPKPQAAP